MRRLLFLAGLFLAASATAQTAIDITSQAGTCSYPTGAVSSSSTPGHLSAQLTGTPTGSGCSTGSSVPAVTFGPASPVAASKTSLVGGTGVSDTFTVLPLNAVSCSAAINTTAGTGTGTLTNGSNVCNSQATCAQTTPFNIPATFTNTSTSVSSTYNVVVTCNAASGASPASTSSSVAVTQAAAASGGTPSANFTFTTNGLIATFADTSTDTGGSIGSWSWNFGDSMTSTSQSPSHTYAAAGTYSVTLTVTDSVSGLQSTSSPQSVTVSQAASCPTITGGGGVTSYSRWSGTKSVNYFGGGAKNVDVTSFNSVFGTGTGSQATWPGNSTLTALFSLPIQNYISLQFTVPTGYMAGYTQTSPALYGEYTINASGYSAKLSMTISTQCGDFSDPTTYPSTSTVVGPSCWGNKYTPSVGVGITWMKSGQCALQDGHTYFLNIVNADISTAQPAGGGSMASTKNTNCGSYCQDPIANGPGTWSNYTFP